MPSDAIPAVPPPSSGSAFTDTQILDWLQAKMRSGKFTTLSFSDSQDMGYEENFLSYWSNDGDPIHECKGNSVREVLSIAMNKPNIPDQTAGENPATKGNQ